MKRMVVLSMLVVGICLLSTQVWSQEHYYMTLDPGNFKTYDFVEVDAGIMLVEPITEEDGWTHLNTKITVGGVLVEEVTRRYSVDAEGNVWFFGIVAQMDQPAEPVLFVDAPLYMGKAWEQTVDYPGYPTRHFSHVCEAEEFVTVPLGTYWCFRVRTIVTSATEVTETIYWYCDGFGRVKIQTVADPYTFELADGVIPVENTTWGAVKSLYR